MAKVTITIDDTNTAIVAALGAGTVDTVADAKGYPTEIANPNYVPAVGSPTMDDTTKTPVFDSMLKTDIYPQIPNPDYVAEVGTPTIPNPDSRGIFVAKKVLKEAIVPYLIQEMAQKEKTATENKIASIEAIIEQSAVIKAV